MRGSDSLSQATEKRKSTLIKAIIKVAKSNPMSRDVIAFNQFIEGYFNNVALSDDIKDQEKLDAINGEIKSVKDASAQGALADMTTFPIIMLIAYLILMFHFKNKGGYKPVEL